MLFPSPSMLPLAAAGDSTKWMDSYGWPLLALFGVFTLSLYIWSYINKNFEVWKTKEGKYFDSEVMDFSRRMTKVFIIMFLAVSTFLVISYILNWNVIPDWQQVTRYIFDGVFIVITILVALLIVRILRRISRRSRVKQANDAALPSALEFTSLFLSYLVYIASVIIVILILVSAIPGFDPIESLSSFMANNERELVVTIAIVIGIYLVVKLVETILEDFKFRSKKFNPQVIDLMESGIKYSLFTIGFLIVIFNIFRMIGMETVGVILVAVTLIFLILGIALTYSTIQNVVSGLALMDTSPFDVGDRIRVVDDLMCDVIEKGLVFTKVKTLEGEIVDIPNSEILGDRIYNYSRASTHGITLDFEASFDISHSKIEAYFREAIEDIDGILKDPKPEIRAIAVNGKNIVYEMDVYSKDVQKDAQIKSQLIFKLQEVAQTEGHRSLIS